MVFVFLCFIGFESLVVVGEFFSFNHQKLFGLVLFCNQIQSLFSTRFYFCVLHKNSCGN